MDISIIIPCFNLEEYIARCLKSIINQHYDTRKFEVILVLDSCTDKTHQIVVDVLGYSGINATVLTANVMNAGLARNLGLGIAKGEFIFFVDGDDYLIDDCALQKLKENAITNQTNTVYMSSFECEDKSVVEPDAIWRFFFKREIIGKTKFYQIPINEDYLFVAALRRKPEYKESRINDLLYHYTHPREGSLTAIYMPR